jgi:predicted permease
MNNVILLLVCLGAGFALRLSQRVPEDACKTINAIVINFSLPALALLQIPKLQLGGGLLIPISMPWVMFAAVAAALWVACEKAGLHRSTTGALILTAGLGNTSFVGVPMIEAFYGKQYMGVGLLIDQLGSYLVLSTLGLAVACLCSHGSASPRDIARRVATFPPLLAVLAAIVLAAAHASYPAMLVTLLQRIAATLAPLALISVGLQLRIGALRSRLGQLGVGLAVKLVVAPLLLALIYVGLLGASGQPLRVTVFEAAMGPMVGGAIVATQYGLDPPLVTLMVGFGTLTAFVSLPVWWYLLQFA